MGRPGMGGGGSRSGGGHSSGRSSGGHRLGGGGSRPGMHTRSSNRSYRSCPRYVHYGGYRGPRRYYGGGGGSSGSCLMTVIMCIFFFVVIGGLVMQSCSVNSEVRSTRNREKLEASAPFRNDCVVDEIGYVENVSKLSSGLQDFYDTTGVQPYIVLKAYDSSLTSDAAKEQYAQRWYEDHIDNETTFLYMYFAEASEDAVGYMCYVNGTAVTSVMDEEAVSIFWNYLDRNWVNPNLIMTDVFLHTFDQTAKTIMDKSTTVEDLVWVVLLIVLAVVILLGVVILLRMKFKRDKEKAEETERILKTPLSGTSDDLKDKYL